MTSTVTLLELLVQPYRDHKDELVQRIFALTSTYPKMEWAPVTMSLADRAAELRARYRLQVRCSVDVGLESIAMASKEILAETRGCDEAEAHKVLFARQPKGVGGSGSYQSEAREKTSIEPGARIPAERL